MWEIDTVSVADPSLFELHHRLRYFMKRGNRKQRPTPSQWLCDFHTVRKLISRWTTVQSFNSPDPTLQARFTGKSDWESGWSRSSSGFLEPMKLVSHGDFRTGYTLRDPITEACEISAVGQIVLSHDMEAGARDTLEIRHSVEFSKFEEGFRLFYPIAASPSLDGILSDLLGERGFAALTERRADAVHRSQQHTASGPGGRDK
ncbi:hypothetical protein AB0L26_03295 [Streptomyces nondiastaticus]|uniref:hypothetical protein n=1 Tax=Streptomyces nondiastaticus TaxID=3154512 RepID=UPI00342976CF